MTMKSLFLSALALTVLFMQPARSQERFEVFPTRTEADSAEVVERVCVRVGAEWTDMTDSDRYFRPFSITVSTAVR